jgi:hypothetical protein
MSVTITIIGILPATAAWPAIAGAAATAASALGFALASTKEKSKVAAEAVEVDISLESSETVTADLAVGEELVFTRDGVRVRFFRDVEGRAGIRVHGHGSRDELRRIGEDFARRIVQQYTYHQLVTELKNRNLNITDELVEEDGTVRLHVRAYQATPHGNP